MKANIEILKSFLNEIPALTNEEQGIYWLTTTRDDGVTICVAISVYEALVSISVKTSQITVMNVTIKNCSAINIVDADMQIIEILHKNTKYRLGISENPILGCTV